MGRGNNWNENGTFVVELYVHDDGIVYDAHTDQTNPGIQSPLPLLQKVGGAAELVIEFNSKGYHDPGSMYGGPDNVGYPPEGDDERTLDNAYLYVTDLKDKQNSQKIPLPPEVADDLFGYYHDQIMETEIDTDSAPDDYWDRSDYMENKEIHKLGRIITEDPDIFI